MSIDFPASPVDQQLFTTAGNGVVYKYSTAYSSWLAQNAPAGVTQTVFTETGAVATGTGTISSGDVIPTNTMGDQYMQLAITPQSATSRLIIEVTIMLSTGAPSAATLSCALFQDATVNALASAFLVTEANGRGGPLSFRHVMTSGTTSATTFKVRAGSDTASTTTFNGSGGARRHGGVLASSIVIREVP